MGAGVFGGLRGARAWIVVGGCENSDSQGGGEAVRVLGLIDWQEGEYEAVTSVVGGVMNRRMAWFARGWWVVVGVIALGLGAGCDGAGGGDGVDAIAADATAADAMGGDANATDATIPDATATDAALPDATAADATMPDATAADAGLIGDHAIFARLPGLWTGPATNTPLGAFPVMNMDIRAADGRTLFSRFDLDVDDGLRFAFAIETVEGEATLVFRNGGYFLGFLRDTRTVLIEQAGDVWTFCHRASGCEYLRAEWRFEGADRLELVVDVRGMRHLEWRARRVEARALPDDFAPVAGPHDGPFPPLPSLAVEVTWGAALAEPAPVWLLVSTVPCGLGGACTPVRLMRAVAPAGARAVMLRIEQVHAGPYVLNAVLDRDGNFEQTLFPDSGDGIAGLDRAVEVGEGEAAFMLPVVFDLP